MLRLALPPLPQPERLPRETHSHSTRSAFFVRRRRCRRRRLRPRLTVAFTGSANVVIAELCPSEQKGFVPIRHGTPPCSLPVPHFAPSGFAHSPRGRTGKEHPLSCRNFACAPSYVSGALEPCFELKAARDLFYPLLFSWRVVSALASWGCRSPHFSAFEIIPLRAALICLLPGRPLDASFGGTARKNESASVRKLRGQSARLLCVVNELGSCYLSVLLKV